MTTGFLPPQFYLTGEFVAPAGTQMPFHMAAPPLGWVQNVAAGYSDSAMRATNTGLSSGGSTAWSGWGSGNTLNMNGFALTTTQLPSHTHGVNDSGHSHTFAVTMLTYDGTTAGAHAFGGPVQNFFNQDVTTNDAGLSSNNAGSGATITPTFTTPTVKFTSFCIGTKS
jgi:hypothetical protein